MEEIEHFPNIQRYRVAKGMSIKEISNKARLSVKQYENIESGEVNVKQTRSLMRFQKR